MTNPFENPEGVYLVLVNDENQHSIWPVHRPPATGDRQVRGPEIGRAHV